MSTLCFLGHAQEVITWTQPRLSGVLDGSVQFKDREEQIWVLCQMTEWWSCAAAQAKDEGEKHEYLRRAHALADVTLSTHRRYAPKPKVRERWSISSPPQKVRVGDAPRSMGPPFADQSCVICVRLYMQDVSRRSSSLDTMASEANLAGVHHLALEFARASVEILPVQMKAEGVLDLVGDHLFNVGRLSEAREILDHAMATYEMGPDVLARALLAKSLLALDSGEPRKALDYAEQSTTLLQHSSEGEDSESDSHCECCKPDNQVSRWLVHRRAAASAWPCARRGLIHMLQGVPCP
jgi:tetratricopeptide (TPR) repeat protein